MQRGHLVFTQPIIAFIILAGIIGCGGVPALPDSFEVTTSATEKVEADAGTGPQGLANSSWSLMRKTDPEDDPSEDDAQPRGPYGGILGGDALQRPPVGEEIFQIHFGESGEMIEVTENRFFLPGIYGGTVHVGGDWTSAGLPGMAFRSASYGVQTGDRYGLAVVVHVRAGNIFLGRAVLYSWGTITGDHLDGQFGYLIDLTEGAVPTIGTIADQYPIEAARN